MEEKRLLQEQVLKHQEELIEMADQIFDLKEISFEEVKSAALLEDYLEKQGFEVERGIAGLPTAFRAVYKNGTGGPSIGLLCEYDALKNMGHGCGHHMQGPGILGAAVSLKEVLKDIPYQLVVYGTPGEETDGGKIQMVDRGCFNDIDVALMIHGGAATQTDVKSMALTTVHVTFHGVTAHAAIAPDKGRSAIDAMLLAFSGIEFLREHVKDDTRMNYTILGQYPGANVIPEKAEAAFDLRSYNSAYLEQVIKRFENVIKGASIMTDTTYEIQYTSHFESKVPARNLNAIVNENAKLVQAPNIQPSREKTGSTDFGNVMYRVPGTCLRIAFVKDGTPSHSAAFIEAGKSEAAHKAVVLGAQIIAMTAYDLITEPELMESVRNEFAENKKKMLEN